MAIFIFDTDAFEKMVAVESEDYRKFKSKKIFDVCSFDAFFEEWQKEYANNPRVRDYRPEFGISVGGNGAIYGLGGWNRYVVLNSGEIALIIASSIPEYIHKAKDMGFRLW
jgi:hypothetical protein